MNHAPAFTLVIAALLGTWPALAQEITPSGFVYPTGVSDNGRGARFLATAPHYTAGRYHLGTDITVSADNPDRARIGDRVFAVADGIVVAISTPGRGWGAKNTALTALHFTAEGELFYAIYGHLAADSVDFVLPRAVRAGDTLGTLGPYPGGVHLHFGIYPGSRLPERIVGSAPLPNDYHPGMQLNLLGFVDPLVWIETRAPQNSNP